jgi:nucleotide-binding universal stress UspA family protein
MKEAAGMSILCAVDFSGASALALRAAGRIAATFDQRLTVTTVGDPLLAAAEQVASGDDPVGLLTRALAEFVDETLGPGASAHHRLTVPLGDAAAEILRQGDALGASLLVLSTQGASGVRKVMFGSVAERVLRDATLPVLVVPPAVADGPMRTLGAMQEVLAPVDFHDHVLDDARLASRVARASHARLRLLHVVPGDDSQGWTVLRETAAAQLEAHLSGARQSRTDRAHDALEVLAASLEATPAPTLEIAHGPVAAQIAAVADREDVDLVVLGLRGTPGGMGTRVGAVAYRVLCASPVPVLAVPHEARGAALAFLDRP